MAWFEPRRLALVLNIDLVLAITVSVIFLALQRYCGSYRRYRPARRYYFYALKHGDVGECLA